MGTFFEFFFTFITYLLEGIKSIAFGILDGIIQLFNIPAFVSMFQSYSVSFTMLDRIFAIVAMIVVLALYALAIFGIILAIRKYVRFRKTIVGEEDLLEELAQMHREVLRLQDEKDAIMEMKVAMIGVDGAADYAREWNRQDGFVTYANGTPQTQAAATEEPKKEIEESKGESRFYRLMEVDRFYLNYQRPDYQDDVSLPDICEAFRNFACSRMHLYYDIKIIRLFISGFASTKMLLLQGISGTGKTSLPYAFGKFLSHDATIASVQPSWRDRTELFGYFNEFTKKFNETEVLKRIYDASFNDDINLIILDEMNIARVEYYFAEMLSILEMPDPNEWKLDLVPSVWDNDPVHLADGKLKIPKNIWYVGTANNDDSTFAISDKVYDRAQPINLDSKGIAFDAPDTPPMNLSYSHLESLYQDAIAAYPVSEDTLQKISHLDIYVIQKMRLAFGNRILRQLREFVPVYVAAGGTELDGVDYILATKIFRKFESLNMTFIRDEIDGLISYLEKLFGKTNMIESKEYLKRLQKMY